MYYGGFTYTEAYNIPVSYKRWFIDRLVRELTQKSADGADPPTRAAHVDTAEFRATQGRAREQVPSRLRRFT